MLRYFGIVLGKENFWYTGVKRQVHGYPYAEVTHSLSEAKIYTSEQRAKNAAVALNEKTGQSLLYNLCFSVVEIPEQDLTPMQLKRGHCWAIYRNAETGGLYAREYIDDVKDAKGYLCEGVLKDNPEMLPFLVNELGAGTTFNPNDPDLVEFREWNNGKNPLSLKEQYPVNSEDFRFGWIAPDGTTYNTGVEGHLDCAVIIAKELYGDTASWGADDTLLRKGFIKTTMIQYNHKIVSFSDARWHWTDVQKDIVRDINPQDENLVWQEQYG